MTFADPFSQTMSSQANVARAVAELRRGGAVAVSAGNDAAIAIAAELIEEPGFAWLLAAAGEAANDQSGVRLLLTHERAARLGLGGQPSLERFRLLALPAACSADVARQIVDPTAEPIDPAPLELAPAGDVPAPLCQALIELVKAARLLPAAVVVPMPLAKIEAWVATPFRLAAGDVIAYRRAAASGLKRVGSARVPLVGSATERAAIETEIIAFRPLDGGKEHLAIVIGTLDPSRAVLTRLHSECFTGDLLGSLRCDCGDQLRGAIEEIAKQGSGVLLYLAQEGRGIGLVNKLRAYTLQDAGADTLEANLQLGFGPDERVYQPAAEMLRQLDIGAIRLLTNNPEKVKGLAQCGIAVVERVPHVFPANDHNERYLSTKAVRFGHVF
jgi:GTP cyclohydrolase II